jgi:hypothetical protein
MASSGKIDWLGLCLDMMSEYLPVEAATKNESKKYWEINEHLKCVMELSGLTRRPGTSERADYLNEFMKDLIRIFNQQVAKSTGSEEDGENNLDNAALNNILLYCLMANSQESEPERGERIERKLAENLLRHDIQFHPDGD